MARLFSSKHEMIIILLWDKSQKSNNDDDNYHHNTNDNHDNDPRADNNKRQWAARIFLQEKMRARVYAIHKWRENCHLQRKWRFEHAQGFLYSNLFILELDYEWTVACPGGYPSTTHQWKKNCWKTAKKFNELDCE